MTDIDWSKWHKLDAPTRRPGWSDARVTIGCNKRGLLTMHFNGVVLQDLELVDRLSKGPIKCDIFEGIEDRVGTLFVRWSDKGAYQMASVLGGKCGRINRIETEFAPELAQKAQACKHVIVTGQGIEVQLPKWFDRDLYLENDRREAAA